MFNLVRIWILDTILQFSFKIVIFKFFLRICLKIHALNFCKAQLVSLADTF